METSTLISILIRRARNRVGFALLYFIAEAHIFGLCEYKWNAIRNDNASVSNCEDFAERALPNACFG